MTLTTVKVQNFDKTITTIPPYALVSDSFQNWRGMRECGGRRIKRSVFIDARTIPPVHAGETARLREKGYLAADTSQEIVNLQALREYLANYLSNCPDVRSDLMSMVRRTLQPTSEGVPLEFYCFTRHFEWIPYEAFQSALTDRVLTLLPGVRLAGVPAACGHRSAMNGTDGIRTQEECLFSDAKRAHSPRRSVSLQRFFRKRCAKYHEIRFACVRSCRRTARTSHGRRPDEGRRGQNAVSTLSDIMPPH